MPDKIIVRAEEEVVCPHCRQSFALHAGLAGQAIERHAADYEAEAAAYRQRIAIEAQGDAERRMKQAFGSEIGRLQVQLEGAQRSEREAREAIDKARSEARQRATADAEQERKALLEDLQRKDEALKALRLQEIELRRQRQSLAEQQEKLELELRRQLDEKLAQATTALRQREAERFALAESEYRKKIEDAQRANEELRRKLDQGSQQLQGEVLELQIEQSLASGFFHDLVEEVKKGQRGADVLQTVRTPSGQPAGRIIWEAKRAEHWSDKWLQKLKDDQQEAKAELAVLVTTAMPRGVAGPMARIGDVWVIAPQLLRPMAETLRVIVLECHKLRQANAGRAEKADLLYAYIASPAFAQRLRGVSEGIAAMQSDLDAERRAMARLWAKRQTQIERLGCSISTVLGDLTGIAQDSLPALAAIDELDCEPGGEADANADADRPALPRRPGLLASI